MRIVIAPDSFKEALAAEQVCQAVARGVRRVRPDATIDQVPMADGGEGTVDALVAATGGSRRRTTVTGPLGEPVSAEWAVLGDHGRTAVIEMAAASGLALVPTARRNPLRTSTIGTGQLIRAALDEGARRILVGIGGSATTDGGCGAAQAVGVAFYDAAGCVIPEGLAGGDLARIGRIELIGRDARLAETRVEVACDVDNPLCGPRGAAAVYSPQKGATPEQVRALDAGLAHLAELIRRDAGIDVLELPGGGAAGGLGAGLVAFFGGRLRPGIDLVIEASGLAERMAGADLVITGEGRIDRQSMMGKVISGIARTARAAGVPIIALAGCLGEGAEETLAVLDAIHVINPPGTDIADALPRTAEALERTTAEVLHERLG